ncbi:LuxR family transcriptional regulator [Wenxinia saemankumensis]|uniref:LuxR family transcriptional regulator n=1 Tax=Wenxinia saemankumensis TaxID=1447782 RepID=A0A1M6A4P8_9RHOB|nr:LuxR family transcriptional regulator [Wenxinia saemankumensis]SHI31417.1 LuxR family transcriptional regulator [Wenxinia saemankumensis]
MPDLLSRLERITNATSDSELWDAYCARLARLGFDRLIYGLTRYRSDRGLGNARDWVLLTNHSDAYVRGYIGEGLVRDSPMLRWALENDGAQSWTWLADPARRVELSEGERRVIAFNQVHEVTAGYTISFRSISPRAKGAMALTAAPGLSQDEVDAIWQAHGREIVALSNVLHLKLASLPQSWARRLTPRQVEVLQWVGDGKTTADIALLLGVTPATVEKHLRLAREAMEVETTAQAVLKAAFYNRLFPVPE